MPERRTRAPARRQLRRGKAPTTAAGEFVREAIHHVRRGKHAARRPQQAIAMALSGRRAGVKLPRPPQGTTSAESEERRHRVGEKAAQAPVGAPRQDPSRSARRGVRQHRIARFLRHAAGPRKTLRPKPLAGSTGRHAQPSRQMKLNEKAMRGGLQLHIGTSGWHYKHWIGEFYPVGFRPREMLAWYAQEFQTVEINNTFYRLPEERTFVEWRNLAPPGFLFAVKASRYLTHLKRLKDPAAPLDLFFSRAKHLGVHLGPVLIQLPPGWKLNFKRLAELVRCLPKNVRFAIEFREPSWYCDPVYELLGRRNVALCVHDWRNEKWPRELTADFTYLRFHGLNGRYGGNYPDRVLATWAGVVEGWMGRLRQVFIYFNNDIGGHAVRNARSLRALLTGNELHSAARPVA